MSNLEVEELSHDLAPRQLSRHKDEVLNDLAERSNVAQFVSFDPALRQRFSRVKDREINEVYRSLDEALSTLLLRSSDQSINIRSFRSHDSKSSEFIYGLKNVVDAESALRRLAGDGLYVIANETIDIADGGVSGVVVSNLIEFAPLDTPRCVEKPGVTRLSRSDGLKLLQNVYGFSPELNYAPSHRVEFSIHPLRRGFRHTHTIIWEMEEVGEVNYVAHPHWPNSFSRFIGDKAFGLLVADLLGLPVPFTTVLPRYLPPFCFGVSTGSGETWLRTCPAEQAPGQFSTTRGWYDPFRLLNQEDPNNEMIASIIAQHGVDFRYSGAVVTDSNSSPIIEGLQGTGIGFMQGASAPEQLPSEVRGSVMEVYEHAVNLLGPVRFEWVNDGHRTWIVQIHVGISLSHDQVIYPGTPQFWETFRAEDGVDRLRNIIAKVRHKNIGIVILGEVGVTSHLGDLLRKAKIPSYISGN